MCIPIYGAQDTGLIMLLCLVHPMPTMTGSFLVILPLPIPLYPLAAASVLPQLCSSPVTSRKN